MASDIFAKLGDIKGESLDDKHKDEIEILSWSWGVANAVVISGGRRRHRGGQAEVPETFPSATKSTKRRRC